MPSRAFLLFGQIGVTLQEMAIDAWFQCPRGHFCFSDPFIGQRAIGRGVGFNALAGIFAFRTNTTSAWTQKNCSGFQCPRGHFCFSDARIANCGNALCNVSMPLRAFLLFGRTMCVLSSAHSPCFNALAGIFAFRTDEGAIHPLLNWWVSMPSRAFLLFGRVITRALCLPVGWVSMPSRAFLLFGRSLTVDFAGAYVSGFNALAGIFAFRTEGMEYDYALDEFCFNALAGIFAFRTIKTTPLSPK